MYGQGRDSIEKSLMHGGGISTRLVAHPFPNYECEPDDIAKQKEVRRRLLGVYRKQNKKQTKQKKSRIDESA